MSAATGMGPLVWRLSTLLSGVGLLVVGVGLLVAIPLVTCVSTAAYRQLFGPEDRTGLTRGLPESRALSDPRS